MCVCVCTLSILQINIMKPNTPHALFLTYVRPFQFQDALYATDMVSYKCIAPGIAQSPICLVFVLV